MARGTESIGGATVSQNRVDRTARRPLARSPLRRRRAAAALARPMAKAPEPSPPPSATAPAAPTAATAPPGLRIGTTSGRGRGVFATRAFAPGELLERASVIVFERALTAQLRGSVLDDYWFWWDDAHNAFALGCGSLYNHAVPANARYSVEPATRTLAFTAARAIAAGEEITINYHGAPDDPTPVWFPTA
jgi:hypothetical protein